MITTRENPIVIIPGNMNKAKHADLKRWQNAYTCTHMCTYTHSRVRTKSNIYEPARNKLLNDNSKSSSTIIIFNVNGLNYPIKTQNGWID